MENDNNVARADTSLVSIQRGGLHLWVCRPDPIIDPELLAAYSRLLTADEAAKQQRLRFKRDRHAALVTRAFLRTTLSAYAAVAPQDWRFDIGARGKPEIADPPLPLRFNLSHTTGMIICALTLVDDIGCDVEFTGRRSDTAAVAAQHFAGSELQELNSYAADSQRSRFFDYWTLKESYIKACGQGIYGVPLKDFSFAIGPPERPDINGNIRLEFAAGVDDDPQAWRSWLFYRFAAHRMALSVRALADAPADYRLQFFESVPLCGRTQLPGQARPNQRRQ